MFILSLAILWPAYEWLHLLEKSDISKCEYHTIIKFLTLEKQPANNIHECLVRVYGEGASSYATVTRWVAEFKRGRTSLEDNPRAGRPVDATGDDCCHAVKTLVMGDRRLKVAEIASEIGISCGSAINILHQHLGLRKVCARWVPWLLTPIQKSFRVETSSELLAVNNTIQKMFYPELWPVMKRGYNTGIWTPN